MRAMVLEEIGAPLVLRKMPIPEPAPHELLLEVSACGVCRTDLHIVDGELSHPKLPLILGHQIVGKVSKLGKQTSIYKPGDSVGVPWLAKTCHTCEYCQAAKENLCDYALFTGYQINGGYAEYCTVHEDYALPLPELSLNPEQMAPLLCAGLIGYRAFKLTQPAKTIGFYGFGSSAHILIQLAAAQGHQIYVFTKPGDNHTQLFARTLGASWTGGSDECPPELLDAAILFAPVGSLYPQALKAVKKGGKVISAGIHMSDIPSFPYELLWEERSMSSVANLTRKDGREFFDLVKQIPIHTTVTAFKLEEANEALQAIRTGSLEGSAVLKIK